MNNLIDVVEISAKIDEIQSFLNHLKKYMQNSEMNDIIHSIKSLKNMNINAINKLYSLMINSFNKWGKGRIVGEAIEGLLRFEWGLFLFHKGTYRDHVLHMLIVYLLGLFIVEKLNLNIFNYMDREKTKFTWTVASLLHDIGYVYEKLNDALHDAFGSIIQPISAPGETLKINVNSPVIDRYLRLIAKTYEIMLKENTRNQKDMLVNLREEKHLNLDFSLSWNFYRELHENLQQNKRGIHGPVSALITLDTLISKNPYAANDFWFKEWYPYVLVAATSIAAHSLSIETLSKFEINRINSIMPTLLILCDEVQDFGRPGTKGSSLSLKNIKTRDKEITLTLETENKEKMEGLKNKLNKISNKILKINTAYKEEPDNKVLHITITSRNYQLKRKWK